MVHALHVLRSHLPMVHLAVIHLPMVHRRAAGFRLPHVAAVHLRMIHRAFVRPALRHRTMIHRRMVHRNFRLGSGAASPLCYRMPHRAMALGCRLALCFGVSLRLGALLRFHWRVTRMLRRGGGGENRTRGGRGKQADDRYLHAPSPAGLATVTI